MEEITNERKQKTKTNRKISFVCVIRIVIGVGA
jgi:hypothetical protein